MPTPATSVSTCPASARSARLLAAIPPTTSTPRIARVSDEDRDQPAAVRRGGGAVGVGHQAAFCDVGRRAEDEVAEMVVDEPVVGDPARPCAARPRRAHAGSEAGATAPTRSSRARARCRRRTALRLLIASRWTIRAREGSARVANRSPTAWAPSSPSDRRGAADRARDGGIRSGAWTGWLYPTAAGA